METEQFPKPYEDLYTWQKMKALTHYKSHHKRTNTVLSNYHQPNIHIRHARKRGFSKFVRPAKSGV